MDNMNDIPDFKTELERKTIEALSAVMHDLTSRKVTIVAARATLKALWDISSGLVARETMELIAQSGKLVEDKFLQLSPPDQIAVLTQGNLTAVLMRHGVGVALDMHQDGKKLNKSYVAPVEELKPEVWAATRFKSLVDSLTTKNYTRIV